MNAVPSWQSSAEVFSQILQRHGVDPAGVTDVAAAWRAFGEFLQVELDGIDRCDGGENDGFIVQWGRYSWTAGRLCLSLTRQLAVPDDTDCEDPDAQPEYWQIELQMCFDDAPDLIGLEALPIRNSGFSFAPTGPERTAELARIRTEMQRYPQLRAALRATPMSSELSLEHAC